MGAMSLRRRLSAVALGVLVAVSSAAASDPVRVALAARRDVAWRHLTTLDYGGGFETKALLYETLVTRDAEGRLAPALAESWAFEDDGRVVVLTLRADARFHDGAPLDADAVAAHLRRCLGAPQHAWLRSLAHVVDVSARSPREVVVTLDEPWALLPDLVGVNPGGIMSPDADALGPDRTRPIGSGAYRADLARFGELRYERVVDVAGPDVIVVVPYEVGDDVLARLAAGEADVVVDDWSGALDRERLADLAADDAFDLVAAAGSAVVSLSFKLDDGPTRDVDVRRAVASAVDRTALVDDVEGGLATPCRAWAAPSVTAWPRRDASSSDAGRVPDVPLRLVVDASKPRQVRLAPALAAQLGARGIDVDVLSLRDGDLAAALERGDYDLRLEQSWGVPYDPFVSLVARFAPQPLVENAASRRDFGVDPDVAALVDRMQRTPDEAGRLALAAEVQRLLDERALLVPLFAPHRLALGRAGAPRVALSHDVYRFDWQGDSR